MIASLNGTVVDIGLNSAVIECAGVGYLVFATPRTLASLIRGEKAQILTTMAVKEDAVTLYGFTDRSDQEIFSVIQTVSGFGPKLALTSLSVLNAHELAEAIANSEAKTLQRIPGVGKRVAERLIVELKDKVEPWRSPQGSTEQAAHGGDLAVGSSAGQMSSTVEQVIQALEGLGFSEKQATPAVESVFAENPSLDTASALRAALSQLSPQR